MARPRAKKSGSKTIMIGAAVVFCLAAAAGGYFFKGRQAITGSKKAAKSAPVQTGAALPAATLKLDSFLVNLADADHNSFLRIGITLGLDKTLSTQGAESTGSVTIPEIRDAVLGVLTTWQSSELLAPSGKRALKAQLLKTLQERVPQLGVSGVYFTDFLIQE